MEKTFCANKLPQDQFFAQINGWFAANRNIVVSKIYTDSKTQFGLLVNKSKLSNVTIIYEQKDGADNLYGIDYVEKFALMKISMDSMKKSWAEKNPHLRPVCWSYTHNARGQSGSLFLNGIGARNRNQLWMIYRVPESTIAQAPLAPTEIEPTAAAPVQSTAKPGFCPNCGYKNAEGDLFCSACGTKF